MDANEILVHVLHYLKTSLGELTTPTETVIICTVLKSNTDSMHLICMVIKHNPTYYTYWTLRHLAT